MEEIVEIIKKCKDIYSKELKTKPHPYLIKMLKKISERQYNHMDQHLYLAGNNKLLTEKRLQDKEAMILCKVLGNRLLIVSIDMSYNNITDQGAGHLAKLIKENVTLKKVNLMCNEIGPEGAELLANSLGTNNTLESLKMNGNKIGKKGVIAFAQFLQINTGLKELDIGHTDQTIDSVIAVATVLNFTNSTLLHLNINRPLLRDQDQEVVSVHITQLLKNNSSLLGLRLQKADVRDFGATRISEGLKLNTKLTHLDLSCNRIGEDGAKELADAVAISDNLQVLDIGYNRIGNAGARYMASMLKANTSLKRLVLVYNGIGSQGLLSIADVLLRFNTFLSSLYIWGNKLLPDTSRVFEHLLSSKRFSSENVDVKPYFVDGAYYLSQLNQHPSRHFYWAPSYGDDVPPEQIYGDGKT